MQQTFKAYIFLAMLIIFNLPSGENRILNLGYLKEQLNEILIDAGSTIEALGHAGESAGDLMVHLNSAQTSTLGILDKLFKIVGNREDNPRPRTSVVKIVDPENTI